MDHSSAAPAALPATLLAIASCALGLGAAVALGIGWFWAHTRGDWQAALLWGYWFGTPLSSGSSLLVVRRQGLVKRIHLVLLALWLAASLFVLIVPFGS